MKKILLTLCVAAATLTAFGQTPSLGIKGGANFAKISISAPGTDLTATSGTNTLFHIGFYADFEVEKNISIQPGIFATGKGGKFSSNISEPDGNVINGSAKFNLLYLQVPVNVVYHAPVKGGQFYFGAGPFLGYGIQGKAIVKNGNDSESTDIDFGSNGAFKKIDAGVDGIVGFKFTDGFFINLNYDLGLTNVANNSGEGNIKTRVFGAGIGYQF